MKNKYYLEPFPPSTLDREYAEPRMETSWCSLPEDQFENFIYSIMITEMGARPLLTPFQQQILRTLKVSPSQLRLSSWAFLRAFEVVMRAFHRPLSEELFLFFFNVERSLKRGPGRTQQRWVVLMSNASNTFFSPFPIADRDFHNKYFYVFLRYQDALEKVCEYDTDGRIHALNFCFGWSLDHFKASDGSYSWKLSQLDARDLVSLEKLREWTPIDKYYGRGFG